LLRVRPGGKCSCQNLEIGERSIRDLSVVPDALFRKPLENTDDSVKKLGVSSFALEALVIAFGIADRGIHQIVSSVNIVQVTSSAVNGIRPRKDANSAKRIIHSRVR
jgi:hypothetical protein